MRRIFICGTGRCGTTHLANRLSHHLGLGVVPESQFKTALFRSDESDLRKGGQWLQLIKGNPEWQRWGINPELLASTNSDAFTAGQFHDHLCQVYLQMHSKEKLAINGYIEHWPGNLSLVDRIQHHYPCAEFIHLVRDPRAVANSLLRVDWGPVDADECATYWLACFASGIACEAVHGARRIRYEDFVQQDDAEFAASFGKAAKNPLSSGLRHIAGEGKYHALARCKTDESRAVAWQTELSSRDVAIVENACKFVMDMEGYTRSEYTQQVTAFQLLALQLARPFKRIFNRIRNELRRRRGAFLARNQ